jgi:phospholipid/cholesterol/gamma-HCH transport system ATP-binding protein
MIAVRNLHKSFDEQEVLRGIDLDIQDNETIVILGPSGQGKTVLIKTLSRLLEPDSGSIEYDGLNVLRMRRDDFDRFQRSIAFVFQSSALLDFLSVKENLTLYPQMHTRQTQREIDDLIARVISLVGLDTTVLDKLPEELSGGMKKRVAIARAIIKRPKYIFYDEPTTGLDKGNAEKISELITELKDRIAATSIVVTHDIKLMRDISDRVALLKQGRIIFVGRKEEISVEALEALYETGNGNGLR